MPSEDHVIKKEADEGLLFMLTFESSPLISRGALESREEVSGWSCLMQHFT